MTKYICTSCGRTEEAENAPVCKCHPRYPELMVRYRTTPVTDINAYRQAQTVKRIIARAEELDW